MHCLSLSAILPAALCAISLSVHSSSKESYHAISVLQMWKEAACWGRLVNCWMLASEADLGFKIKSDAKDIWLLSSRALKSVGDVVQLVGCFPSVKKEVLGSIFITA